MSLFEYSDDKRQAANNPHDIGASLGTVAYDTLICFYKLGEDLYYSLTKNNITRILEEVFLNTGLIVRAPLNQNRILRPILLEKERKRSVAMRVRVCPNCSNEVRYADEEDGEMVCKDCGAKLPKDLEVEELGKNIGWKFVYKLPPGMCDKDFEGVQREIEVALDAEVEFSIESGLLHMDIMTNQLPRKITYKRACKKWNFKSEFIGKNLPIIIGESRAGVIVLDLAEAPHMLVAGETGGGKSNLLWLFLATLPLYSDCYIIDLKRVEFNPAREMVAGIADTLEEAVSLLKWLDSEMRRRMDLFVKVKVRNIKDFNRVVPEKHRLGYISLLIDELSQLSPDVVDRKHPERKAREEAHFYLTNLMCLARVLGIHIVLCTQRPDRTIVKGQEKANCPVKISFRTDQTNSQIVFGQGYMKPSLIPKNPGRCVLKIDTEMEIQCYFMQIKTNPNLLVLDEPESVNDPGPQEGENIGLTLVP